jgi:LuxR family transcriptional regulator, maltose regulon positive regulatory protein
VLLTKLFIPSVTSCIVHRTKLYDILNSGRECKLILVSAPAGYGKSTLISDWIRQNNIRAAWYSLDEGDNDIYDFFKYVIKAVQSVEENFGSDILQRLKSPEKPANQDILNLIINRILNVKEAFTIVLDDFHFIKNTEILALFSYFLEFIPPDLNVILLSRITPDINLSRLRSSGMLLELYASDLVFSENDIHAYFNKKLKINVTPEDIRSLYSKTEGWAAGIQLIALSVDDKKNPSGLIKNFNEDNRHLMDYLLEEVLNKLSDEIIEFLTKVSIPDQFTASLCNALTGRRDSQQVIEMLEKNNLFIIPLDDQRNWYRFHHLFGELLKKKLLLMDYSEVINLHYIAGEWFYKNSLTHSALQHSVKSENFNRSINILEELIEDLWEESHHSAVLKYASEIPEEFIRKSPLISLYYSWILITKGQTFKAEPLLLEAEQITNDFLNQNSRSDSILNRKFSGKIAVAQAYLNSFLGRPDKILAYCKTALANLSDEDPLWFSWAWYSAGIAYAALDEVAESIEALKKAQEYSKRSGNWYVISTVAIALAFNESKLGHIGTSYQRCEALLKFISEKGYSNVTQKEWSYAVLYANMAAIEWLWCDLDKALPSIKTAYSLIIQGSDISYYALILTIYSGILQARGDVAGAVEKMNELEELIHDQKIVPGVESMYLAWKAIMLIAQGQPEKASIFLQKKGINVTSKITNANEQAFIPLVLVLLSSGRSDEAKPLLIELQARAEKQKRMERLIEIKILYAILFSLSGEKENAIKSLREALCLSSENGAIIYYLAYIELTGDLLKVIFSDPQNVPASHLEKLKNFLVKKDKSKPKYEGTELSMRELNTLKLLETSQTNQELADNLFVSLNTVKTHLKSIYAKLNVGNRAGAIKKARDLGLLK